MRVTDYRKLGELEQQFYETAAKHKYEQRNVPDPS